MKKQELFVKSLPYRRDSPALFQAIAHLAYPIFLDSGQPYSTQGRFDILTASPRIRIVTNGNKTEVHENEGVTTYFDVNPLSIVRQHLPSAASFQGYPFLGGAMGYFAYDLGRQFEILKSVIPSDTALPDMMVGIYDWAVVVDHSAMQTALLGLRSDATSDEVWQEMHELLLTQPTQAVPKVFQVEGDLCSNMSKQAYKDKFDQIIRYIHAGDCYQVNLAQKFSVSVSGDPFSAYCYLRQMAAAPFSAYMDCGTFQILSSSPERFLQARAGHITTKPIKGTRKRLADAVLDQYQIDQLRNSAKDRSENLMIVDLIRNDMSKNCRFSSVRVSDLFGLESFTNVHHLVSTIEGDLREDKDIFDLLQGCFPGGSITGAPKLRAMEIIEELEPDRRHVYCGSIGYISAHGDMDLNIAIRTAVHQGGMLHFYAGGGIVADSDSESEYQETLDKVSLFFCLLGMKKFVAKRSDS